MNIVILTGAELRHDFMRKAIALDPKISVLRTYCERTKTPSYPKNNKSESSKQNFHLDLRNQSERDFFEPFITLTPDQSNPMFINYRDVNLPENIAEIINLNPDLIVAYGCSIIKKPLIDHFHRRFLNIHLGLSPYYRGSGTNFWPLVNGEPEFVGATFMYIDYGIDTGDIIHQIRARFFKGDSPHQVGNRLIADAAQEYIKIIKNFNKLKSMRQPEDKVSVKYYKTSNFSDDSVGRLYQNFEEGLVDKYLIMDDHAKLPILTNPSII